MAHLRFPIPQGTEDHATVRGDVRAVAARKRVVADAYAGLGWEVPRLLAALDRAEHLYFDEMSQVRMSTWSSGRIALVGDAGYCGSPMSGHGTSQALIGAYVLAGELAKHGDDHTAAFAAYERTLRDYVEANHELARHAVASFSMPVNQEMLDAMAAATTDEDSHDRVSIEDYAAKSDGFVTATPFGSRHAAGRT